jgi:hypothetical protein
MPGTFKKKSAAAMDKLFFPVVKIQKLFDSRREIIDCPSEET